MQVSPEELILILSKWESERTNVVCMVVIQSADGFACIFRISGVVTLADPGAAFSVGEPESAFVLCEIPHENVDYLLKDEVDQAVAEDILLDPDEIEELVFMRNPDRSTLALFTLRSI